MCIGAARRGQAFRIWQLHDPIQESAAGAQSQDRDGSVDQRALCSNFQGEQQAPQTRESQ